MITKENLKSYFDALKPNEINEALESNTDNIACYIGSYGSCYLESVNDDNETEMQEATESTGGFICDKDDFLRLFEESGSTNETLTELIA
jgi:hypothetical protein